MTLFARMARILIYYMTGLIRDLNINQSQLSINFFGTLHRIKALISARSRPLLLYYIIMYKIILINR